MEKEAVEVLSKSSESVFKTDRPGLALVRRVAVWRVAGGLADWREMY